jgi:Methyltransferase domain
VTPLVRAIRSAALPADTRSRHRIAAQLLGSPATVLDVGGVKGVLELFLPAARILTVNVERPADVLFGGKHLPFRDSTFEAVTSLDVLEHIATHDRASHIAELARVASSTIVLSCPLGTERHRIAETELAAWYRNATGVAHRFLEEHLANGLPTDDELRELAAGAGLHGKLWYHGDFRIANSDFRLGVRAGREARPDLVLRYVRARLRRRDRVATDVPTQWTNRVFLILRRQPLRTRSFG